MLPVYVVHLPDPKRKERISAELAKAGFDGITFVAAQEPFKGFTCNNMRRNPRGEFGCALSHVKAMMFALATAGGSDRVLFVEDDIEFIGKLPDELPADCQILYLGGHPRGPVERVSNGIVRVKQGWSCAESYVMTYFAMRRFLPFWCDRAGQKNAMFDIILGEFAAANCGYAVYPVATRQPAGWSHIGQKIDDKSHLIEKGWRENLPA